MLYINYKHKFILLGSDFYEKVCTKENVSSFNSIYGS